MERIMTYITEILILFLILITFMQAGIDKIIDWKGNTSWLKEHFSKTFLASQIPFIVGFILVAGILTGSLAVLGIIWILVFAKTLLALASCVMAAITLLMLLFGQRIAKDYTGAFYFNRIFYSGNYRSLFTLIKKLQPQDRSFIFPKMLFLILTISFV